MQEMTITSVHALGPRYAVILKEKDADRSWELFGAQGVTVDHGVRPALDSATTDTAGTPDQPAQSMVADLRSTRGWWQFWKKS